MNDFFFLKFFQNLSSKDETPKYKRLQKPSLEDPGDAKYDMIESLVWLHTL